MKSEYGLLLTVVHVNFLIFDNACTMLSYLGDVLWWPPPRMTPSDSHPLLSCPFGIPLDTEQGYLAKQ
jgi:hypothetical protein